MAYPQTPVASPRVGDLLKADLADDFAAVKASGEAVLAAGTVTVTNAAVTASSRIRLTTIAPGGTVGVPHVSARAAGSFTITSTSGTDTSTVYWEVVS